MEKNLIFTAGDLADCSTDFETLGIEKVLAARTHVSDVHLNACIWQVGDTNTLTAFFSERADVLADFALASQDAVNKGTTPGSRHW